MVVSGLFVSLWATMAVKAAGGEAAVAQYQVFLPFAVIQIFAVGWSFVFGSILDKVNGVVGLALALCVVAYGAMYFVESPLGLRILPLFAVLGCAMAAGMLFSAAAPWAPFLLMAGAQAVLIVRALLVWLLAPGEPKVASATTSS